MAAGVGTSTVERRLRDPRFKARLEEGGRGMVERAAQALSAGTSKAIDRLVALVDTAPAPVQLGAARAVLYMTFKAREIVEFEKRLAALEEKLKKREARGPWGGRGGSGRPWPTGAAGSPPNGHGANGHGPNGQAG